MRNTEEVLLKNNPWHSAIFPWGYPQSIVAAAAFHVRVRDGVGVVPLRQQHQESCWVVSP